MRDWEVVSYLSDSAGRVAQAASFAVDLPSSEGHPARFPPRRKTAQSTRKNQANQPSHFADRPSRTLSQEDTASLYAAGDFSRLPYPSCMMPVLAPFQDMPLDYKSVPSFGSYDLDDPLGSPPFSQSPCISENGHHGRSGRTFDGMGSLAPLTTSRSQRGRNSRDHGLGQTGTHKAHISSIKQPA